MCVQRWDVPRDAGADGGRFTALLPSAPGVSGGFDAGLALRCPFAGLGVGSDPPPVPVRGGGGRCHTEIGIFTPFSSCIVGIFFSPWRLIFYCLKNY